ncbi:hypothetical protein E2986_02556 [Frieseomelitta varia]|uniref:Succinate dehydrogenase [ubiquinone] cytochrome b small subunit n=1 Tax=Frieseomelitta varia TaxID=561572 RepID=A0A833S4K0_9HYME|nr:hypothetical protein E2986_02556 [Frieseomelitta varia]
MILKRVVSPTIIDKVKQLESLSKTTLFANSCRLPQFGRTSSSLATARQCLDSGTISNRTNCLTKFPTTAILGTQISRSASTSGDHVRLWVLERVIATALPFLIPAALITENSILDGIMGLEAMITDYARPNIVGPVLPKILHFSLLIVSAITLCGLFVLINNGPGVSRAVKDAWAIGKTPPQKPIAKE